MTNPLAHEQVVRDEACSLSSVRRVASMLDLDSIDLTTGGALPRGWQFLLLGADTKRSALRTDGFPGLGVPMPDIGLPRLMIGGRSVEFVRDIAIGSEVQRTSGVQSVVRKENAAGSMAVVTVRHELRTPDSIDPALVETQTYMLMPARSEPITSMDVVTLPLPAADHQKTVVPDETLLFQYSALGFNSHKIHLNREYAREAEGFPDLVVNGGLSTLLLTEFLRRELDAIPTSLKVRYSAPLFCDRPVTLIADQTGSGWRLKALDEHNRVAIEMEVTQ